MAARYILKQYSKNLHKKLGTGGQFANNGSRSMSTSCGYCLFNEDALTKDQMELRDLAHSFFLKELPESVAHKIDQDDDFPGFRDLWKKMGTLGLHGITAPKVYGGLEMGYLEHCLVVEAMSQFSGSLALSYGAHSNLNINQLVLNGTEKQKETYLPKLIDGSFIGSLAMSEPNSGSDVTSMRLKATKKGDYYVLNGTKFWITNGTLADVVLVYAKTSDKDITAFLVERDTPGFSVGKKVNKMGMRGSPTAELIFENCIVPETNIVGGLNKGVYVLMSGLDYERLVLAAGPLGLMQRACDLAFEYAHQRQQFNQPIGKFQAIQFMMADMFTETMFCRSTLYSVARSLDEMVARSKGGDQKQEPRKGASEFSARCAAVILKLAESGNKVCDQAVQIFGGNGFTQEYEVNRLLRDVRLYRIGAGTSEIRRMIIGREINKAFLGQ